MIPAFKLRSANKKFGRCLVGAGIWDSWGFGLNYSHYSKAFTIEFIHWYVYVEYWTKQEAKEYEERMKFPSD